MTFVRFYRRKTWHITENDVRGFPSKGVATLCGEPSIDRDPHDLLGDRVVAAEMPRPNVQPPADLLADLCERCEKRNPDAVSA